MATIAKLINKKGETVFRIRVSLGTDGNGKRKVYSTTYKPESGLTEKQMQKKAESFAGDLEKKLKRSDSIGDDMRLSELVDMYLTDSELTMSPINFERYSDEIRKRVLPKLGNCKLSEITRRRVQEYVNMLAATKKKIGGKETGERLSAATVQRYLRVLQSILNYAVKQGLIDDSPARVSRLVIPKAQKTEIEVFSPEEVRTILEKLENESLQFRTLIYLALFSGLRCGEIVALKFSDVDFERRTIKIERAASKLKNKKQEIKSPKDYETRTVPIPVSCCGLLRQLQQEKQEDREKLGSLWVDGDWIFTQWNGEMMHNQTPSQKFTKFLNKIGMRYRKFHALRHTYATMLLRNKTADIVIVQKWLGHSSIETTQRYLHYIETEENFVAVDNMEDMLLPKKAAKSDSTPTK